jgi:DNA-binding LacI/PurR family transcriptional regulator
VSASPGPGYAAPARQRPRRPIGLAELADRVGVSVPTVSKVLNGRPDVAPATRSRVLAAIDEFGRPRLSRPGRPAPRREALELLFYELESTWAIQILWGVQQAAMDSGVSVLLSGLASRFFPPDEWVQEVVHRRPLGVIFALTQFTPAQRRWLADAEIPAVILDPPRVPAADQPRVSAANRRGGQEATEHLIALGHRRIALAAGPEAIPCAKDRQDGYRAAMARASLSPVVRSGNMNADDGAALARDLLRLKDRPTAIVTSNDLQAMGVYTAAREAGLVIPDQLSVVGFDNLSVAQWMSPALTTIHQPLQDMAVAATDLVLGLAWGNPVPSAQLELDTHLVLRGSTAPPQ